MILKTLAGMTVSLVRSDKQFLYERDGSMWCRDSSKDTPDHAAYTKFIDIPQTVLLSRADLRRVCAGSRAMATPTTVEEMRDHAASLGKDRDREVSSWPDQKLREMLADADEQGKDPGQMLEKELDRKLEPPVIEETHEEATERPTEAPKKIPRYPHPPRPRKQEGSVSLSLGEASVLLTPKQLEFMERLSENSGWSKHGVEGEYSVNAYAVELADTMNAMSVGAVVTTLREKHLLNTTKTRVEGIKTCMFKLTDLGVQVYKELSGGRS